MERYSEYKDSGAKWLGKIPKHWDVIKAKYLWNEVFSFSENGSENLLSVSQYDGITQAKNESRSESLKGYKKVAKDNLVINIMLAWMGGLGVSEYNGIVSPAYCVYRLKKAANPKFMHYLYKTPMYLAEFARHSTGVIPSRWRMYTDDFGQVLTLIPPIDEQDKIVSYLDKVTSKIDEAIAQQQKMIDLLNERKQIIINNAVTKGLNPDVPMKYSGVDWIGEIPEHWTTIRLGYCAWIRARLGWKGLKSDEYVDNGYPFLSAFNIVNNKLDWNKLNYINKFRYEESPEIKLRIGDILLVKDGAGIGKCARVDSLPLGEATANGSLAFITANERVYYKFLHYYIISNSFNKYKDLLITGMGVPHLTQGEIKNMMLPIPPLNEQYIIVQRLDKNINVIDNILEHYLQQITFLQERKRIIINDVVTGKVKVS
ncbi:restriction endonuclease subunit S [Bacteroides gallinaceum]|uniref:restriction endonuclease subunit S n=1 Tax=Bacteroides gallinaceum TaxID=1462571 RepID=UPI001958D4DD|nr:restriction endonuclease subunit S [Bacteroides gallinaceum]MBM6657635.1 restriction endonuclease subunit S [Bacteroides gallinaceum]